MDGKVGAILSFLMGGLVGAIVAYKFAYDKAEERADMEISEMRDYFQKKEKEKGLEEAIEVAAAKSQASRNKPSVDSLSAVQKTDGQNINYTMYSEGHPADVVVTQEPVLLEDPDEFGDIEGYSRVNMTYYDDLILSEDSTMKALSRADVEKTVGVRNLDRLGEKDENGETIEQIYIRNDRLKSYFSVVRDDRDYQDAVGMEDDGEDY